MNVYLPCRRDALEVPKKCAVKHTTLLYMEYMASVVILHLVRLVGDGRMPYVEAKQRELRLAGIVYKMDRENSAERSYPSFLLILNLQLDSFEDGMGVII